MAARKSRPKSKDANEQDENQSVGQPRPFWSGVIAFGLVSLPVSLFPANRGKPISLNMTDSHGHPLRRQYFCEKENRRLEQDEIVRGYPIDKDRFVIIEDEELEALAPEKTREIDLGRFVPQGDVNPVFFERGYFLAPDTSSTKAYRLLARSMEEEERIGIATFVMRDKEYIIAIMSEQGILRAETLRFHDEIRSPQQASLPELGEANSRLVRSIKQAVKKRSVEKFDPALLKDQQVQKLQDLVREKLAAGKDLIEQPDEPVQQEDSNVVDLIQVLKARLKGNKDDQSETGQPAASENLNRDELYAEAQKKGISGRSKMNKDELLAALRDTG